MKLYPQITLAHAKQLISDINSKTPAELNRELMHSDSLIHSAASFSATGGSKVSNDQLKALRHEVISLALAANFPTPPNRENKQKFDAQCAKLLHQRMQIEAHEAANIRIWMHMTCVLFPDIVRWRFHGEETTESRFIGSDSGRRRNTIGRLWWRAYQLHTPGYNLGEYALIERFGEDDLVQVTERPAIFGSEQLSKTILMELLNKDEFVDKTDPDRLLIRDVMKRIRRLITLVAFEALPNEDRALLIRNTIEQAWQAYLSLKSVVHHPSSRSASPS